MSSEVKSSEVKKNKGQFYTTNSAYILEGLSGPPPDIKSIIEPFAGKGDLIEWVKQKLGGLGGSEGAEIPIEAYDIDPKRSDIKQRDTLTNPPDYTDSWIITNPPYLARNKSVDKELYNLYETNDLYKCFINCLVQQNNCRGGILIIPAGFFFSPRDIDVRCRHEFMTRFKLTKVRYFEETVFDDTTTTIVVIAFEKLAAASAASAASQDVLWEIMPSKVEKVFNMAASNDWIIGGEIYNLPIPSNITIRRHVEGQKLVDNEQQTFITLNALDSGSQKGRIKLEYKKDYVYPAKECSRTYATLRILGKHLTEAAQIELCEKFNEFIEQKRANTWSLFLPQFRESKEYARKRIPFKLVYRILLHLISQ